MTDPMPPCEHDLAEMDTAIADGYCPLCLAAAIAPWRAKLAEQCGKTLAAQAQRDELRGLLADTLQVMESAEVYMTTREKIKQPEGSQWYGEAKERIRAALSRCAT